MRRVILESPYAGNSNWKVVAFFQRRANIKYARRCVRDSLSRGESCLASHLLYTQPGVLRDADPVERQWGIDAGLAWGVVAEATVVYVDRGVSKGMEYGISRAITEGRPVICRALVDQHRVYAANYRYLNDRAMA